MERPILFSAPMVRAILEGRKTQTRRVVKPQPTRTHCGGQPMWGHDTLGGTFAESVFGACMAKLSPCPFGQPGDRLWVRETFFEMYDAQTVKPTGIFCYRATHDGEAIKMDGDGFPEVNADGTLASPWRSPIYMPRIASQITLEIVRVRVERLQEIEEADAVAEGVEITVRENGARDQFRKGWDTINGKRAPWASNPWVWRIEFRRLP